LSRRNFCKPSDISFGWNYCKHANERKYVNVEANIPSFTFARRIHKCSYSHKTSAMCCSSCDPLT
jgi:hypothetical protein